MDLPNFRKTVRIKFWSLRTGIGPNMGVIFDCDEQVERDVYRVKTEGGWKWQIKGYKKLLKWDAAVEGDQEILDDCGVDLEFEYVGVETNRQT